MNTNDANSVFTANGDGQLTVVGTSREGASTALGKTWDEMSEMEKNGSLSVAPGSENVAIINGAQEICTLCGGKAYVADLPEKLRGHENVLKNLGDFFRTHTVFEHLRFVIILGSVYRIDHIRDGAPENVANINDDPDYKTFENTLFQKRREVEKTGSDCPSLIVQEVS